MGNLKGTGKKVKAKAGNPRPRKGSGPRSARSVEKPFRLEVGKTYESRDGRHVVEIIRKGNSGCGPSWPMTGRILVGFKSLPFYREDGGYYDEGTSSYDLVREVPTAKRSPTRRGGGK